MAIPNPASPSADRLQSERRAPVASSSELRPFLTRCEVAELLRISERTVRRLESVGRLRSLKLTPGRAGRVLFRREELLRFVSDAESHAEAR
jgi:excisionase family DNA binding protein